MSWYFAYCNFNTSGVKSFADDLAVRNGPVSSRVALLLRSAEGKPSFASISPMISLSNSGSCRGFGFWVGAFDVSSPGGGCRVSRFDLVKIACVSSDQEPGLVLLRASRGVG